MKICNMKVLCLQFNAIEEEPFKIHSIFDDYLSPSQFPDIKDHPFRIQDFYKLDLKIACKVLGSIVLRRKFLAHN